MNMKNILITVFLAGNVFFFSLVSAQEDNSKNDNKDPFSSLEAFKNNLYSAHEILSKNIMRSTNWVDSFFGNKKQFDEQNGTRLNFYHILSKFESEDVQARPGIKINLKFPNLEKKLQINIEKRASNEDTASPIAESNLLTERDLPNKDLRTSASLFLKNLSDLNIKFTAGVRIKIPPRVFSHFRVSKIVPLPFEWNMKSISTSYWEQVEGVGQSLSVDFDRRISDLFLLRIVNESAWTDENDTISSSHGPSLFQKISLRRAISYNFRFNYLNRPNYRIDNYSASISYRQNISKSWLFYELVPQINFARIRNFKSNLGIALKTEFSIGDF